MPTPARFKLLLPLLLPVVVGVALPGCSHLEPRTSWERRATNELRAIEKNLAAIAALPEGSVPRTSAKRANSLHVARLTRALESRFDSAVWQEGILLPGYRLTFDTSGVGRPFWARPAFDEVIVPKTKPRRGAASALVREGIGAPVILKRHVPERAPDVDPLFPPNGISIPATSVVLFDRPAADGRQPARLAFANPHEVTNIRIGGAEIPLAIDFEAALVEQLGSRVFGNISLRGLLNPEKHSGKMGVFATEQYDPNKIPVIFIHGLNSDPHIWLDSMKSGIADPEINKRYQAWYFLYPTGLPIPASARVLRKNLEALREHYDPDQNDPAFRNIVLVGHSMGGLLARLQVIDSGEALYAAHFRVPPENLIVSDEQRELIRESLFFKRVPSVARAVFIATPHRGSKIADLSFARLFEALIKIPRTALSLTRRLMTIDIQALNPQLMTFRDLGMTSVQNLSPRHPFFEALEERPILVPYHSIIGNRGSKGDLARSSDGVVPYTSSHLEGASSELVVPYSHGCVEKPEVVAEVNRILRLHAGIR